MSPKLLKIVGLVLIGVAGNNRGLQAATIDLGLQLVSDNVLTDSLGANLGSGAVFIGNWKDGITDYSATLANVLTSAAAQPDPVAGLGAALSTYFTIGHTNSWSGMLSGGPDAIYAATIASDTGLAGRLVDAVFFNGAASVLASYDISSAEYGSLRWNSAWPTTDDLSRASDFALVVPSLDLDSAPSVLVGSLVDNGDGTGQFQTIPEPSVGYLMLGAGCLWFATRRFKNKS
jgi:hypothetical protein